MKVVRQNGWECSICRATGDSSVEFKTHIFYNHNDQEVEEKYQRSWNSLLSKSYLNRLRKKLLTNIKTGRFDVLWFMFSEQNSKTNLSEINLRVPLYLEKDPSFVKMR